LQADQERVKTLHIPLLDEKKDEDERQLISQVYGD
jgi:hypothetical protein